MVCFGDEDRRKLHEDGCLELHGWPHWEVFSMVEGYHRRLSAQVVSLLEAKKPWKDEDQRPGTAAAWEVSREMEGGVYVSAVHPSVNDQCEETGPRFYVSIIEAAIRRGPAPRLPPALEELVWPRLKDRREPWITELGWTLVPPGSDPQTLHVDILASEEEPPRPRRSVGRFHHLLWKCDGGPCTTKVVCTGFTEGTVEDWHYEVQRQVRSPKLILDSEMLHCGASTPKRWTSTLTVQLCSTSGWRALHCAGRASQDALWYVWPMEAQVKGTPEMWAPGAKVEALWEDGFWYAAKRGAWTPGLRSVSAVMTPIVFFGKTRIHPLQGSFYPTFGLEQNLMKMMRHL
ncbi:unnamed protein product [Effrenium voratum]|nr:unnamed protein product [Effrenium voratum]